MDCSCLVKTSYYDAKVDGVSGNSYGMAKDFADKGWTVPISGVFNTKDNKFNIDESILEPGDILFYDMGTRNDDNGAYMQIDHVSMYIGSGQIIQSTPSLGGVQITELNWGLREKGGEDIYNNKPILRMIGRVPGY